MNFALFSENADAVDLCIFDSADAKQETHRLPIKEQTNQIWHVYLPDARPGLLYGYRVHGPYDPSAGHRFNPAKVLVDPYAKCIARVTQWDDSLFAYQVGHTQQDLAVESRDSAAYAPLGRVIDASFTWGDDRRPNTPWHDTIIYETHVKGITKRHPEVPEALRGTYSGLACEPVVQYLRDLGITAVELLPVHHHVDDNHLRALGLTNYWGYNTLAFFAPDLRYHSGIMDPVSEFKMMVRALHEAGIEVILDVVYNHTAEGNHLGPTLSLRGIDNAAYYRLSPTDPRYYVDYTGCGNTLNMQHPHVLQLIMDSLRYWITEMHVDGFRFDLASTLARELRDVDRLGAFFDIIHQDPIISQVKLIAEPWDLGEGGYQVGNFPVLWTEWNGKYRDTVRRFWAGAGGQVAETATRLAGSSDLYERTGRRPHASINFITCHDGFTLADLVTYQEKHNEANGENNRDGCNHNDSWNFGVEGPTNDPDIQELRTRQRRNFMATLLFSQGVPMICGGDEFGRSQQGNNNAYCQDNELTWYDWSFDREQLEFLGLVRRLIRLRKDHPVLRRRTFFQGRRLRGSEAKDIAWFSPSGREMTDEEWMAPHVRSMGMRLFGDAIEEVDRLGHPIVGETLLIILNAHSDTVSFVLPAHRAGTRWDPILDTARDGTPHPPQRGGRRYGVQRHSLAAFVLASRSERRDRRS